ncbi:hypothetical protein SADUNF_Sadunf12G0081600 [Salix dunnii]|uniref:Uncharacterized protein n=1 Tax=Salix dunnii TaxID=1413687 RepID=A0A835JK65_9ROSI|nr:hypothetical protein SADUNF_Sadunf12G0081600 [Salix dunnii]
MEPNGDHIIIERLEAMTPIHSMEKKKKKQGQVLAPDVDISPPLMWLWMLAINLSGFCLDPRLACYTWGRRSTHI